MGRKMLCVILLIAVLGMICLPVYAGSGTICVSIGSPGEVTLYRVGVLERDRYRLTDEHGGGLVTFDDILMPELASWLAIRSTGGVTRSAKDGVAVFSGLSEGLYLAVQADGKNEPVLISMPWDGDTWNLDISLTREEVTAEEIPLTGERSIVVVSSWIMAAAMLGLIVIGSRKKY